MKSRLGQFAQSSVFIWVFLFFVLITHIPTGNTELLGDDYVQWGAVTLPQDLYQKGLQIANPDNQLVDKIKNMFLFLSADSGATQQLKAYGAIPWWINDDITMHMFRPLSALTHWFDYQYLDKNVFAMQFHSLLYILLLALSYFIVSRHFLAFANANSQGGRSQGTVAWIPALAVALFIFSYSVPINFNWLCARNAFIAPLFALWTLWFHHLWADKHRVVYLLLSMASMMLTLLAAEAGVATLAYIGAYALLLDERPFFKRMFTILPALLVVVLWRVGYSSQGFGAENIDLYVDPVRSPYEFVTQRIPMLPIYYAKVVLGPLAMLWLTVTSSIWILSSISLVACALVLWPLWPLIKSNRLVQFGLLGSVVAIIPFLSTNPSARSEPFLQIGFFLALAIWLFSVSQRPQMGKGLKIFIVLLLGVHLVVPTLLVAGKHWRLLTLDVKSMDAYSSVEPAIAAGNGERDLVIVNSPDYFAYYHRPFSWSYNGQTLPRSIKFLAPGLTRMTIERLDKDTYRLTSAEGFAVLSDTPAEVDSRQDPEKNRHRVLGYRANNQIMTKADQAFSAGQDFSVTGMDISISVAERGVPKTLIITLHDVDAAVWQWYDWSDYNYKPFTELEIGESTTLLGPFDPVDEKS
ncbi:MAG: hypothetical protein MI976_17235 [Pseudomonadales bacterium]|nr:hypothetical protein [Pseudomonadales bacterium]